MNKDLTDAQAADLVAFLDALTGEFPVIAMPRLPGSPNMSVILPVDLDHNSGRPSPQM